MTIDIRRDMRNSRVKPKMCVAKIDFRSDTAQSARLDVSYVKQNKIMSKQSIVFVLPFEQ